MQLVAKANTRGTTVPLMGRPTLGSARNEVLRRLVRELLTADFGDTQAPAARAFGVSPATLSDFISGKKGAGNQLQDGLSKYLRRSLDQITAVGGDLAQLRGLGTAVTSPVRVVCFGDLPNWSSLRAAAMLQRPSHAAWVWERGGAGVARRPCHPWPCRGFG